MAVTGQTTANFLMKKGWLATSQQPGNVCCKMLQQTGRAEHNSGERHKYSNTVQGEKSKSVQINTLKLGGCRGQNGKYHHHQELKQEQTGCAPALLTLVLMSLRSRALQDHL